MGNLLLQGRHRMKDVMNYNQAIDWKQEFVLDQ